jgi:hypothetical protein
LPLGSVLHMPNVGFTLLQDARKKSATKSRKTQSDAFQSSFSATGVRWNALSDSEPLTLSFLLNIGWSPLFSKLAWAPYVSSKHRGVSESAEL